MGLGNPGRRYARTRHNVGFMVADDLAERYGIEFREKASYRTGRGSVEGNEVVLLEPLTFMNNSGMAVHEVAMRYKVGAEKLIIVHDDIDMETGRLKIREKGSSGGHKGVASIIEHIGTGEFIRVKVGIGREEGMPVEEYVLSKFRRKEVPVIKDAIERASKAVSTILVQGVERAMNLFNQTRSA